GARLLGRFAYADETLNEQVQQHLRREESLQPEAVFAEIVHLPEDRMGNVLCRPVLRGYEIPYLGPSGAPKDRQIEVTDLMVSIRGGRIVLRSRRLNREVIPRLTSAHNFLLRTLGVYQFLGALQHQGIEGWSAWNWGPLKYAPFLPRVTAGRTVLCRATWNLSARDIVDLQDRTDSDLFSFIQQWRAERRIPRYVLLVDRDNELPIDMENILSLETFIDGIKGKPEAQLVEMFPGPDDLCVAGTNGRHVHELVVPFHREREPDAGRIPPTPEPQIRRDRCYQPGGDWAWLNLFAGNTTIDRLLVDEIRPRIGRWTASGQIDRWFFLRFNVPGNHLRLRLHGEATELQQTVIPELNRMAAGLLDDGLVSRAQWDTYEPEVNRYGGSDALPLAEEIFSADSDAALDLIAAYGGDAGADLRWRIVLLGLDRLLDDLGFDLTQKQVIARHSADEFAREFSFEGPFRKQFSQKHREVGPELDRLLRGQQNDDPEIAPAVEIFAHRSARIADAARQLQDLERQQRLVTPRAEMARSLWHMQVNRMLRAAHRAQELVLYDLIARQYESQQARMRPKPPKSCSKKKAKKPAGT
ncbi:MAG: thiopeptide-type bacteriocin biosynthesis protein, partial [Maioricimonas sp. JB045]